MKKCEYNLQMFAGETLPVNPVIPEMNYETEVYINTTPSAESPTWAPMTAFMKNMSQSLNEVIDQAKYYGEKGWGHSHVTGGQLTLTVTADVAPDDAACAYLLGADVLYKWGKARQTHLKLTRGNKTIIWAVTLANITPGYGDAGAVNALSLTIHGNGQPVLSETE